VSDRRFANFSVETLEKLFDESRKQVDVVNSIAAELSSHRTSRRARQLLDRVTQAIAVFGNLEEPEEEEPWSTYERQISDAERAYILRSPVDAKQIDQALPLWSVGIELARVDEHTLARHVRTVLEQRGSNLMHVSDEFGYAARVACFELRNGHVQSWQGFALLFRKMLGENGVPWIPMLFLAAVAAPDIISFEFDFEEVLRFRDEHRT